MYSIDDEENKPQEGQLKAASKSNRHIFSCFFLDFLLFALTKATVAKAETSKATRIAFLAPSSFRLVILLFFSNSHHAHTHTHTSKIAMFRTACLLG
jgi:hypothetical protein